MCVCMYVCMMRACMYICSMCACVCVCLCVHLGYRVISKYPLQCILSQVSYLPHRDIRDFVSSGAAAGVAGTHISPTYILYHNYYTTTYPYTQNILRDIKFVDFAISLLNVKNQWTLDIMYST